MADFGGKGITVLECEKCGQAGANDFTQLDPAVQGDRFIQRFQCNKCGAIKKMEAICSGIALSSLRGTHPIISMADFYCLKCGFDCYIGWNYCPRCGAKLGEEMEK